MAFKPDPNLSPADAAKRHAELMTDQEWSKRYMAGDSDARAEMAYLQHRIAGVPFVPPPPGREQAIARQRELERDPEFRAKFFAGDVAARQEMENLNRTIAED